MEEGRELSEGETPDPLSPRTMTLRSVRLRNDSMGWAGRGRGDGCGGDWAITLVTPCITRRTGNEGEKGRRALERKL